MQKVSLEELKSKLGHWVDLPVMDNITLKAGKESGALYNDPENPSNEYIVFARPEGLQLSPKHSITASGHYGMLYAEVLSVELMHSTAVLKKEGASLFFIGIFGLLFYLIGSILGEPGLGLTWLPSGLVFGLLISMKRVKKEQRPGLQVILKDSQTLVFSISMEDKNRVMAFFLHYLENKFRY